MRRRNIRLFSSDLDGTLLGGRDATARFAAAWSSISPGVRPILVYNTGRTTANVRELVAARGLPEPDYILGSVGTELYSSLYDHTAEFTRRFEGSWDLATIARIVGRNAEVRPQPAEFLHAYKSSWYWDGALSREIQQLRDELAAAGIVAHVDYSCRHFLDVVPADAGKGNALAWLAQRLGVCLSQVLVAGDTGNDLTMFHLPEVRGIVVQNALPELAAAVDSARTLLARESHADGVVEGLRHFAALPAPGAAAAVARPSGASAR